VHGDLLFWANLYTTAKSDAGFNLHRTPFPFPFFLFANIKVRNLKQYLELHNMLPFSLQVNTYDRKDKHFNSTKLIL